MLGWYAEAQSPMSRLYNREAARQGAALTLDQPRLDSGHPGNVGFRSCGSSRPMDYTLPIKRYLV